MDNMSTVDITVDLRKSKLRPRFINSEFSSSDI